MKRFEPFFGEFDVASQMRDRGPGGGTTPLQGRQVLEPMLGGQVLCGRWFAEERATEPAAHGYVLQAWSESLGACETFHISSRGDFRTHMSTVDESGKIQLFYSLLEDGSPRVGRTERVQHSDGTATMRNLRIAPDGEPYEAWTLKATPVRKTAQKTTQKTASAQRVGC